jgi:hypothetical protein
LVGKAEEKMPLGRRRHVWDDDIKRDLQEIREQGMSSGFIWFRKGTKDGLL